MIYVTLRVTPVAITSLSGEVPSKQFMVSGNDAEHVVGTVTLHDASNNARLATAKTHENGTWTAPVTLPDENKELTFYAKQQIGAYFSPNSATKTVYLRVTPVVITEPSSGEVPDKQFTVRGTGGKYNVGTVTVHNSADNSLLDTASISSDGTWIAAKVALPIETQPLTFYAKQKIGNNFSANSNPVTVTLGVSAPAITGPAESFQESVFTLTGNLGRSGAKIYAYEDLTSNKVGESDVLSGTGWSCPVTVPVGSKSLVVTQRWNGKESPRSAPLAFKIRPPALTAVDVTVQSATSVKFSGNGHTGATVVITVVSGPGGTAPAAEQVVGGKWETTATNWPFGTYSLSAIQKVPDNANGWIESLPYTFPVDLKLTDPTDVTYTKEYRPTISGKGYTGATVKLFNADRVTPAAPDAFVSNGQWSSKASAEWGPVKDREVHIKQYKDGQASLKWVVLKVTIPPLAPDMNEPVEDGLSPKLSGTCWPTGVLNLKYSDSTIVHPVPNNNGNWSFQRDRLFEPDKTHTASITQTAAGQTSPPVSKSFVVYAPIPKPVITDPEPNSEVGPDATIHGQNGMAGATMQLRDAQFGRDLGEPKLLTADGEWFINLMALDYRPYTIDAQQTLNGRASERSEPSNFRVVLVPPVFTDPKRNGDMPRNPTIKGWGTPLARVTVWLEGIAEPVAKDIPVDVKGRWEAEVVLPVGSKVIYACQTLEGRTSKDSLPLNFNVVPEAPFMENPAEGEPIGRKTVVSGFGVKGDTVTVRLGNPPFTVLGQTLVQEDRTWSMKVRLDQPGGHLSLVAMATCDAFESADSPERAVVLGTYLPSIDEPMAGRWVNNPVRFEGQGRSGIGQVVSWFNPDQVLARDLPVATGRWQGAASLTLPNGGNWCRFKQTITDGADGATVSDWVESQRFEILPPPTQRRSSDERS